MRELQPILLVVVAKPLERMAEVSCYPTPDQYQRAPYRTSFMLTHVINECLQIRGRPRDGGTQREAIDQHIWDARIHDGFESLEPRVDALVLDWYRLVCNDLTFLCCTQ